MHVAQHTLEVGVAPAGVAHVHGRVRVDDLVAQSADAEVRPLREEHDAVVGGAAAGARHEAAVDGPQPGEEAGDGGLAGAVGARDEEVVAGAEDEGEGVDERGAGVGEDGGGDDGGVFEADAGVAFVDCALDVGEGEGLGGLAARGVVGCCVHAVEGGDESVDT